jgi:hypothetical protein
VGGKGNRVDHATHLVLLQHHKVKMLDALLRILPHPLNERRIRNDIADIFIYERVPAHARPHQPSPTQCPPNNNTHLGISCAARSPYPFFSVLTISIFAYSWRWKLYRMSRAGPMRHEGETGRTVDSCRTYRLYSRLVDTPPASSD